MSILIEAGADPFLRNAAGQNAFFLASLSNHSEVMRMLDEYAMTIDETKAREMKEPSAYLQCLQACKEGSLDRVKDVVEEEVDVDGLLNPTHGGYTPLYYATFFNRPEVVEYLLSKGSKLDTPDKNGSTPLMAAAQQGHEQIVRILISAGADPLLRTHLGETARDMIRRNSYSTTIEYLLYSYEMRVINQERAKLGIERPLKKQRASLNMSQLLNQHQFQDHNDDQISKGGHEDEDNSPTMLAMEDIKKKHTHSHSGECSPSYSSSYSSPRSPEDSPSSSPPSFQLDPLAKEDFHLMTSSSLVLSSASSSVSNSTSMPYLLFS